MRLQRIVVTIVLVAVAATIAYAIGRSSPESARSQPTTTTTTTTTTVATPSVPKDVRRALAALVVEDRRPPDDYSRDLFPLWLDLDGNGCDARVDAAVHEALRPAEVDHAGSCAVLAR